MKKVIYIERCSHCNYIIRQFPIFICCHPKGKDEQLELTKIPSWCPLPDYKEEK